MSTMLQELLRWRRPARPTTPVSRWAAWSRSLSERHGRIGGRHQRVAMTLVRPLGLMLLHSQRWRHVAWTLSPRINLVLGPVLQRAEWRRFVLQPPDQSATWSSALRSVLVQRLDDGRLVGENQPDVRPVAPARQVGFVPTARESRALGPPLEAGPSPMRRVFARLHERETLARASQSQIVRASRTIARRVAHGRQRVETRVPTRVVVRDQRHPTSEFASTSSWRAQVESQPGVPPAHAEAPPGMRMGANPMGQAMAPPSPVAIQQLTEQVVREIDRRLVAQRERMGKF